VFGQHLEAVQFLSRVGDETSAAVHDGGPVVNREVEHRARVDDTVEVRDGDTDVVLERGGPQGERAG
jgi:hypothetical protein